MAGSKNTVPEAKEALNRFKMEAANEEAVHFIEIKQKYILPPCVAKKIKITQKTAELSRTIKADTKTLSFAMDAHEGVLCFCKNIRSQAKDSF